MKYTSWPPVEKALRQQGWTIERTKLGHRCIPPDRTKPLVIVGSGSTSLRALRNGIAALKRSGFVMKDDEDGTAPVSSRPPSSEPLESEPRGSHRPPKSRKSGPRAVVATTASEIEDECELGAPSFRGPDLGAGLTVLAETQIGARPKPLDEALADIAGMRFRRLDRVDPRDPQRVLRFEVDVGIVVLVDRHGNEHRVRWEKIDRALRRGSMAEVPYGEDEVAIPPDVHGMAFGEALRTLRVHARMSQEELASMLGDEGLAAQSLYAWEKETAAPLHRHYEQLCDLLYELRDAQPPAFGVPEDATRHTGPRSAGELGEPIEPCAPEPAATELAPDSIAPEVRDAQPITAARPRGPTPITPAPAERSAPDDPPATTPGAGAEVVDADAIGAFLSASIHLEEEDVDGVFFIVRDGVWIVTHAVRDVLADGRALEEPRLRGRGSTPSDALRDGLRRARDAIAAHEEIIAARRRALEEVLKGRWST